VSLELSRLAEAGVVSSLDANAARTWARVAGEQRDEVVALAALVSRAVADGHVCLDLHGIDTLLDAGGEPQGARVDVDWPSADAWEALLGGSPIVHAVGEARAADVESIRPLVFDDAGRVYLRRYWEHQETLAASLRDRLAPGQAVAVDEERLQEGLERLFPRDAAAGAEPDLQRIAAEGAVRSRFFVISGGPGTGKTSTVVKILALLVEQAAARGGSPPHIRLLAPTGKAAAHLSSAVSRSAAALDCAADVVAGIPREASTVHRALGAGGTPTRYRHDADHPLEADVVLVDEASMVDLALMARLASALPAEARLILLGDRDQLASVEAGAVLGDIAGAGDDDAAAPAARPVVHLLRSHRFDADSPLGALVGAVHAGDADRVLDLLDDAERPEVRLVEPGDVAALHAELLAGYGPFEAAVSAAERLAALDCYRVLCAHRRGPQGVAAHNRLVETLLADRGVIAPARGGWYAGRPILIARNDYAAGLYNGDVGVVDRDAVGDADPAEGAALRVLFRTAEGGERWISPRRLGAAETVFAMSVHKSQGSEFDAVLVVLPEESSPIVSRELLYTAVSRARQSVCLSASREALREALALRVERSSGLRDAIWGRSPS